MRAILIVGTGRSGTSALAGAIYALGVHFCEHLIGRHPDHNPKGHFECRQWWQVGNDSEYPSVGDYDRLIATHRQAPVWAIKDTWIRPGLDAAVRLMGDARVIVSHRQFGAVVNSRIPHGHENRAEAEREQIERSLRLYAFLERVDAPVWHVDYEHLLSDARGTIDGMADFIFEGLDSRSAEKRQALAARFVTPRLNHHSAIRDTKQSVT